MKKALTLILVIMSIVMLAQGQADNYTERVKKTFPDIRFDLIKDDWQNDPYLRSYLEQRLSLFTFDSLSVLKKQATEANNTAQINIYVKQMKEFFNKNMDDFKKLSTLLDSCIRHSKSELLLALLLQNWDNIWIEDLKSITEKWEKNTRNSYYGDLFTKQMQLTLSESEKRMRKNDYLYAILNAMPNWNIGQDIKLKLEYNLFDDHTTDMLIITISKSVNKLARVVTEHDIYDTLKNILYFQTVSQSSAELQSVQELLK
jgi:hypothetical protein